MQPRQGAPGTQVTVTVTGVEPATAEVTVRFDGAVVATGDAVGGTAQLTFTVPSDAANGNHSVTASAPNGTANCGSGNSGFVVTGGDSEVLGGGQDRSPGGGGGSGGGGDGAGGGSLARTGFSILGFVLAALVLIVAGRQLQHRSRAHSAS